MKFRKLESSWPPVVHARAAGVDIRYSMLQIMVQFDPVYIIALTCQLLCFLLISKNCDGCQVVNNSIAKWRLSAPVIQ